MSGGAEEGRPAARAGASGPVAAVRGLGEVALRCRDMGAMRAFYEGVLGLTPLAAERGGIQFYALGPGWRGHTAVLALFGPEAAARPAAEGSSTPETSTLHHIALSVDWEAQDAALARLAALGLPARSERFDWIGWRGVFTEDPEGNVVELVAADPARER
ncbi:VOC family protein [Rubrimonas cliftonensis]|uniref:Glyoxalase/Bleomycin resistance protein/Dioxygenase superfamily protein n=1 Tax=Rubrimonas cliftonensis TaxID=89524 RepID=A0A1H4EUN6_9RHOB|nr:VOC family protein [Rubrimonas cliftonensis]SEA88711.1 Glyoxalase/Bleomycin resistance protein/Dioxygenase superfamily protein [Rubrimonas cliftonensis]